MHQKYNCNNSLEIFKIFYICRDFLNKKCKMFLYFKLTWKYQCSFQIIQKEGYYPFFFYINI